MSHDATNWAIKQRGLKPATKLVLWHLCDRFNPDFGCFPKQDTLANDCEMSRSALNEHLIALEKAGLIAREQRRDEKTRKQISTNYRFAFETDFPCPESRHGTEKTVSGNVVEPCPETDESRVRNPDTNLVIEPVREPVIEREAGEENSKKADRKAIERSFKKAFREWPTSITDSEPDAYRAWMRLTVDERQLAHEEAARYVDAAKETGRKHVCSHAVYLREKRWEKLPVKPVNATGNAPAKKVSAPFGKLWGAYRMAELLGGAKPRTRPSAFIETMIKQGGDTGERYRREWLAKAGYPAVVAMHEQCQNRNGYAVDDLYRPLAENMEQVRTGSDLWNDWRDLHERMGWLWFDEGSLPEWVWFPKGGVNGLTEFKEKLAEVKQDAGL